MKQVDNLLEQCLDHTNDVMCCSCDAHIVLMKDITVEKGELENEIISVQWARG